MSSRISRWIGVAACTVMLTANSVQAQDAPTRQRNRIMRPDSTERIVARQQMAARQVVLSIARRLELDERQVNALRVAVEGADDEAGAGWRIAALLQRELTKEQKERLFEQADRAAAFQAGVRFGRGPQAGRLGASRVEAGNERGERASLRNDRARIGGGRGLRPTGQPGAPAMGQAMRERADAMAEALGLTESQRELMRIHRAIRLAAATRLTVQARYRDRISSR